MDSQNIEVDVLVIGGGAAGPMAAVKAKEANACCCSKKPTSSAGQAEADGRGGPPDHSDGGSLLTGQGARRAQPRPAEGGNGAGGAERGADPRNQQPTQGSRDCARQLKAS